MHEPIAIGHLSKSGGLKIAIRYLRIIVPSMQMCLQFIVFEVFSARSLDLINIYIYTSCQLKIQDNINAKSHFLIPGFEYGKINILSILIKYFS